MLGNKFSAGRKLSDSHKEMLRLSGGKNLGRKHTLESRMNMSISHIGKTPSEYTRKKLSDATRRIWKDELIRNRIIESRNLSGRSVSTETKAKISRTLMGHFVSDKTREKQKARRSRNVSIQTP